MMPISPHETSLRRADFLGGLPVRLADGQEWALAGPREVAGAGDGARAQVAALLLAIAESEDETDRLRGELALAILLLSLNYDLSPADYSRLLAAPVGDPILQAMQAGFRDLAGRHAEALRPRREAPPASPGRRFRFPAFRPNRPLQDRPARGRRAC